jgi:hypothetical protein
MKFRHFSTLHSDFDTEECVRRLIQSIDPAQRTIFSLSGYRGTALVIGWLDGNQFYLHKRRIWRNDFAPLCYGNFVTQDKGTLVECYFDLQRWTKRFMNIWLALAILIGVPIFAISVYDLFKSGNFNDGSEYLGMVAPVGLILFGIYLPKFGLLLGKSEEDFILEFLQRILVANKCDPSANTTN